MFQGSFIPVDGVQNTGLHLYTDNYYTSVMLFNHLYTRDINACRRARCNHQHFPKDKVTSSNRDFSDYHSNGPLFSSVWVDK